MIKNLNIHFSRKQYFISLGIIFGIALLWSAYLLIIPKDKPLLKSSPNTKLTLKPQSANDFGMQIDSKILIDSKNSINIKQLKKSLTVEPKVDFSIAKQSDNQAILTFDSPLKEDRIYKFTLLQSDGFDRSYSWAYQVRAPFQVLSTIPSDKTSAVKKNTVIEFTTNRENFIDPKSHITITPNINFNVEQNGRLIIVEPNQAQMQNNKIYSVTLHKELQTKDTSESLAEDTTIQFETEAANNSNLTYFGFNEMFYEVKTTEHPIFGINLPDSITDPVKLSLYKFSDPKVFGPAYNAIKRNLSWAGTIDESELAKYASSKINDYSIPIIKKDYNSYVQLPDALPNAYYILCGQVSNVKDCTAFQSTRTISFLSYSPTKSLIWLNNLSNKKPIASASISLLGGDQVGQTDDNGVWFGDTPTSIKSELTNPYNRSQAYFLVNSSETVPLLIPVESKNGYIYNFDSENYQSFLSTDKPIYQKSDKVNFWGIARKRDGSELNNITVQIHESTYSTNSILYEKELSIGDYGTFTGSFNIEDLSPGTYSLSIYNGDTRIATQSVEIATYVKPAYKLTLSHNKDAIFSGEEVQYSVKAEFFDGSPVSNTEFNFSGSGYNANSVSGKIRTDASGQASFKLNPTFTDKNNYPHGYNVEVTPTNAEESDISISDYVSVFISGINLEGDVNKNQLNLTANNIILDKNNYIGTPAKDVNITGTITWQEDVKTPNGEVYNPISKLMETRYTYTTVPHMIKDFIVKTGNDGKANYDLSDLEKNKNYQIDFAAADSSNRRVENRAWYRGNTAANYSDNYLKLDNFESPDSTKSYKIGENVKLLLKRNSGDLPANSNYLFINAQNGLKDYSHSKNPSYDRTFQLTDIPNIATQGVWFDGQSLYESNQLNTYFDKDERKLNIKVNSDKTKYLPGDKVQMDVSITDPSLKGKQAEVNLAIIDDALNYIGENRDNDSRNTILNSFYAGVNSNFYTRISHSDLQTDGGKGGGGDDSLRSDIIDVAYYGTITTNDNGKGHIEFKLPDNITSFRVTAYAISKDLHVGQDVSQLIVSKPMFVDATLNENYLTGDDVTLRLRAFGQSNSSTEFGAKIKDLNIDQQGLKADANGNVYIPLGKMPVGTHDVIVSAKNGANQDNLLKKITVYDSYYSVKAQNYYPLASNLSNLKTSDTGRTELQFMDQGKSEALSFLYDLFFQFGERADQIVSRNNASDLLKNTFKKPFAAQNTSITSYQIANGGIALFPYGGDNLELTAKLSDLGADVSKQSMINYFTDSLTNTKADADRRAIALYGLATLDQPYLAKLQSMAKDPLTLDQASYVAMGLIKLGDLESANTLYQSKIIPNFVQSGIYIKANVANPNTQIKSTANAAIVASALDTQQAVGLRRFVRNYNMTDDLTSMEKALIARYLANLPSQEVSFKYSVSGKTTSKTLQPEELFSLSLTDKEAKSIKFSDIKGNIGLISTYSVNAKPTADKLNPKLTLTRAYKKNGKPVTGFNEGDFVDVYLTPKIPGNDGSVYVIEDYLPSGLKLASGLQQFSKDNTISLPIQVDGQKVKFMIFNDATDKPIHYKARIVSRGTYKADPATLLSIKNLADLNLTSENSITIK